MAYPPTSGNRHQTVFLDPGHGGPDPGTVGTTSSNQQVMEKTETLAVALRVSTLLRQDGYRVVLSRTRDSSVTALAPSDLSGGALTDSAEIRDLNTRVLCAEASGAAVLLSIHFNAFSDSSVGGTETFYDDSRSFSAQNLKVAEDVQSAVVRQIGTPDRGVSTDTALAAPTLTNAGAAYGHIIILGPTSPGYVDHPTSMPGALIEGLFISDPTEADLVVSSPDKIALGIKNGLEAYLSGG